jgi:heme iron utilization protein
MSDPNKGPAPALTARGLIRSRDRATLATSLTTGGAFWPYASLVLVACDLDASPLLLISKLAEHTKNLHRQPRASLLFDGTAGRDDPLTGPRVTVLGEVLPEADPDALARFIRRHPAATAYAGFKDFGLHRMRVGRAHLVAGFGRIDWIEGADLLDRTPALDWLRDAEAGVLQHMNADHADTLDRYAQSLLGLAGTGWQLTGIDREGGDLRRAGEVARVSFPSPVTDVPDIRQAFVALAQSAQRGTRSQ